MARMSIKTYRKHIATLVLSGGSESTLKKAILNGYVDNSKDTWIRHGIDDSKESDEEVHVGLLNPHRFAPCLGCQCPEPPAGNWIFQGIFYESGQCVCKWIQSGPFGQIFWAPAKNCPETPDFVRSPTRTALFFKLLDSAIAYNSSVNINSRLPNGIDSSRISKAKLIITVKSNNGWPSGAQLEEAQSPNENSKKESESSNTSNSTQEA